MKIKSYSHFGRRANNEDYLAHNNEVFIVCDGVGGSEKGEEASRFVAQALLASFSAIQDEPINKTTLQQLIKETQYALNARLMDKPEENGMGTTLTLMSLTKNNIHIAHIGDSRVYFVRPSKEEYWHTKDHSLVQELVDAGIITEAKARTHPKKNHITRAIQATTEGKAVAADIVKINEIVAGDIFLICSDGVMEAFDDDTLIKLLLRSDLGIEDKLNNIKDACAKDSSDNNTAILIQIEEEDAFNTGENEELKMRNLMENAEIIIEEIDQPSDNTNEKEAFVLLATDIKEHSDKSLSARLQQLKSPTKHVKWFFIVLILIIGIAYATPLIVEKFSSKKEDKPKESNTKTINNDKDKAAFREAEKKNTVAAYEEYLRTYPDGSQRRSAERKLDELKKKEKKAWDEATKSNTKESFEAFLKNFENSSFQQAAKDRIVAIENKDQKEAETEVNKNKNEDNTPANPDNEKQDQKKDE